MVAEHSQKYLLRRLSFLSSDAMSFFGPFFGSLASSRGVRRAHFKQNRWQLVEMKQIPTHPHLVSRGKDGLLIDCVTGLLVLFLFGCACWEKLKQRCVA
jgi:hypothetical protein